MTPRYRSRGGLPPVIPPASGLHSTAAAREKMSVEMWTIEGTDDGRTDGRTLFRDRQELARPGSDAARRCAGAVRSLIYRRNGYLYCYTRRRSESVGYLVL